jgi:DnaJ-class molecular chaperone
MKDYYQVLGIPPGASEEEIRRAYRRLALQHHPDRNPGDPSAEERFKEISEAYGVLMDRQKRQQYDGWRWAGGAEYERGGGFRYSQEEILRDLFANPHARRIFEEMLGDFQRAGLRFDRRFFDEAFFGGSGIVFGGVFVWGPFGARSKRIFDPGMRRRVQREGAGGPFRVGFLERLGKGIGRILTGERRIQAPEALHGEGSASDLNYSLTLSSKEAVRGTYVNVAFDTGQGRERLKVRIPPGTKSGTRLRLRGKGLAGAKGRGDLYLTIEVAGP